MYPRKQEIGMALPVAAYVVLTVLAKIAVDVAIWSMSGGL